MDCKAIKDKTKNEKNLPSDIEVTEMKSVKNCGEYKNTSQCHNKTAENKITNLKTELSNKVTAAGILSESEASTCFETVSSVDSKIYAYDLDLSSAADDDINEVIEIENALACQNHKEPGETSCYWKGTKNTPISYNCRRQDNFKVGNKEQKYWQGSAEDKSYRYDKRDKKSADRETFDGSPAFRGYNFHKHGWGRRGRYYRYSRSDHNFKRKCSRSSDSDSDRRSRSSDRDSGSRRSRSRSSSPKHRRSVDHDCRLRRSRSNGHDSRGKRSRSRDHYSRFERSRSRSRASRSPEWMFRSKSPGNKFRKTEAISRNFDKSTSNSSSKWNFQSRKKKFNPFSKSAPSIQNQFLLQERNSTFSSSYNNGKKSTNFCRKNQRIPSLVEVKLKETYQIMNSEKGIANGLKGQPEVSTNMNDNSLVPETSQTPQTLNQNPVFPHQQYNMVAQNTFSFPFRYTFPSLSMENLPLVLGPNGVPIHITPAGEHIPHDFEGRRIPVGPNGHYLPLDPTGRLFAHVIFPDCQAVPIHMTEDGVLRLPNSVPVPYGSLLPVNIDGRIIPIGPDSRPLYPCPNLPRHPPHEIVQMMPQMVNQQIIPTNIIGHQYQDNVNIDGRVIPKEPDTKPLYLHPDIERKPQHLMKMMDGFCTEQTPTLGIPQNISQTGNQQFISTEAEQRKNRNIDQQVKKNLEAISSKEEFKGSLPMKLSVKKYSEDYDDGSDMMSDTGHSDSTFCLVSGCKSKKEISKTPHGGEEAKPSDQIAKIVKHAIQSLCERHYKPPVFGRFIISNLGDRVPRKHPDESPLLRNRIMLPFLNPNAANSYSKDLVEEKTEISFKFLPEKMDPRVDGSTGVLCDKNSSGVNIPVFKLDFAMQCDFTSAIIKSLNSKITELEREVIILKSINANLLKGYKNIQSLKEKKNNEFKKALKNIGERNNEIRALQHSVAECERLTEV